jgi:hypothetical protein
MRCNKAKSLRSTHWEWEGSYAYFRGRILMNKRYFPNSLRIGIGIFLKLVYLTFNSTLHEHNCYQGRSVEMLLDSITLLQLPCLLVVRYVWKLLNLSKTSSFWHLEHESYNLAREHLKHKYWDIISLQEIMPFMRYNSSNLTKIGVGIVVSLYSLNIA